jgi:hypothetical protein
MQKSKASALRELGNFLREEPRAFRRTALQDSRREGAGAAFGFSFFGFLISLF